MAEVNKPDIDVGAIGPSVRRDEVTTGVFAGGTQVPASGVMTVASASSATNFLLPTPVPGARIDIVASSVTVSTSGGGEFTVTCETTTHTITSTGANQLRFYANRQAATLFALTETTYGIFGLTAGATGSLPTIQTT